LQKKRKQERKQPIASEKRSLLFACLTLSLSSWLKKELSVEYVTILSTYNLILMNPEEAVWLHKNGRYQPSLRVFCCRKGIVLTGVKPYNKGNCSKKHVVAPYSNQGALIKS